MRTLLDLNNIALCFGNNFTVTDTEVQYSDGTVCVDLNSSNTTTQDLPAPEHLMGGIYQWVNGAWVCINPQAIIDVQENAKIQINESVKKKRHAAYIAESDPLYFKSQRGEATQQEWLDKIAEIDARYPYVT